MSDSGAPNGSLGAVTAAMTLVLWPVHLAASAGLSFELFGSGNGCGRIQDLMRTRQGNFQVWIRPHGSIHAKGAALCGHAQGSPAHRPFDIDQACALR